MNVYDVVVIGGGPAGLMAAGTAAENGAKVLLIEKMGSIGRKLLISGKGRCNITNTITNTKEFVSHFGKSGKFLYQAFNAFSSTDTISFFNDKGMVTKVDKDFKIFPMSDLAEEVLSILTRYLKEYKVEIRQGVIIQKINTIDNKITSISTATGDILCKSVILATGGKSYPKTGSTGEGYNYAERLGHSIIEPRPALVPVVVKEGWIKKLQGMSPSDALFSIYADGKKISDDKSDAVFTENGLSGPAIYNLTRKIDITQPNLELAIDFIPDIEQHILDKEIAEYINENSRKKLKNMLEKYFQPKLLALAIEQTGTDPEIRSCDLKKEDRKKLVTILKNLRFNIEKFAGFERAVVTAGGIDLKEIDGKTMGSKLIKNLYFAGEIINLDGPTGGFNLQLCWSTGRLAGKSSSDD
ncbi:MAG: aminoacetone oxidase family FAD-binding enzyme [Denitrovibrio sp.]|nr:MAG: aminoacetone oxidase family FAD-binding enzyme [Denitrovibrio sp.]